MVTKKVVNPFKFQSGQTLMVMIMLMTIAMFIGISVSSRFIKNIRLISATDNSVKATSIAEALVERILLIPSATLESYISNNNCGTDCALTITDTTGQALTAVATLSFSGNSTSSYAMKIMQDATSQVLLTGYPTGRSINICWNGSNSITGLYVYTQSGITKATPFAYNAASTSHSENGFSPATANLGYANCFSISAAQTPIGLRLKSVYGEIDTYAIPEAGYSIPIQGIQISSVGQAGDALKKVVVIKSKPSAPAMFDYVLYQKSASDTLSN
jgi:hypothetical protein